MPSCFVVADTTSIAGRDEVMLQFHLPISVVGSDGVLRLASNCQCQVWYMKQLQGYAGDRCGDQAIYARSFPIDHLSMDHPYVTVRMHWVHRTRVTFRRTFDTPLLWVDGDAASEACAGVVVVVEEGYVVGQRACSQLPKQAALFSGAMKRVPATVHEGSVREGFRVVPAITHAPVLTSVAGVPSDWIMEPVKRGVPPSALWELRDLDETVKAKLSIGDVPVVPCFFTMAFDGHADGRLKHMVLDLGSINSYWLKVDTSGSGAVLVVPSEVQALKEITGSPNRFKTKQCTMVGSGGVKTLFPLGCRYLHLFTDRLEQRTPVVHALRAQYPLRMRSSPVPGFESLFRAGVSNLTACIMEDGVLADTCGRERSGWTGDGDVGCRALEAVADNPELIVHYLTLVSTTYNAELGMVGAMAPQPAHMEVYIPSYHLLYCLLVAHLLGTGFPVPGRVRKVVQASLEVWRSKYISEGLVVVPSAGDKRVWHFIDWSYQVACYSPEERKSGALDCNAVLNALWAQTMSSFLQGHGLDLGKFYARFEDKEHPGAYRIAEKASGASLHATTNVLLAGIARDATTTLASLEDQLKHWSRSGPMSPNNFLHGGPTAFYGGFVAAALDAAGGPDAAREFIKTFYGHWARILGTIPEKKTANASLAHLWSIRYLESIAA